jgi:hypothetical protein
MTDKSNLTPAPGSGPVREQARSQEDLPVPEPQHDLAWALNQVQEALRGLRFGQITITVQDGVVVQVERVERRRFQKRPDY